MRSAIFVALGCLGLAQTALASEQEFVESPRILRLLKSIKIYDQGCHLGPMPDKAGF